MWKKAVWPNLYYCPEIFQDGLRKTTRLQPVLLVDILFLYLKALINCDL
jgi:hypothetical protein